MTKLPVFSANKTSLGLPLKV